MSKRVLAISIIGLAVLILSALSVLVIHFIPKPNPVMESVTIEAGIEELSCNKFKKDPESKDEFRFITDMSKIDLSKTGSYDIEISCDDEICNSTLIIVDTTPPQGTGVDRKIYDDETLEVGAFVKDIKDCSDVTTEFLENPDFTKAGEQTVEILLKDAAGNQSSVTAVLTVIEDKEAPKFGQLSTITIREGNTVSYRKGVSVTDNRDKEVDFTVNKSEVNLQKAGTYTVTYSATDKSGNTATAKRTIKVLPKLVINQALVDDMAENIVNKIINGSMSKHQKIETIYNYVRNNMSYVSSPETDIPNAAYVAFTKKRGDCYNYYAMTKLLLDHAGIENKRIDRYGGATSHYWLIVNIGSGWYHYDTTPQSFQSPYRCFMKTTEEVLAYSKSRIDGRADYYSFKEDMYPPIATNQYTY